MSSPLSPSVIDNIHQVAIVGAGPVGLTLAIALAKLGVQVSPSWKKNLLLGIFGGLVLGCGAAFARDAIDDAVHSSDELKKQVALPLLGMTPEVTALTSSARSPKRPG